MESNSGIRLGESSGLTNTIRKERPDRVINSRMVRRLKLQEGTFQKPKAKSRWCVLGQQDPDAADMFTYAPTPQTEIIVVFLFLLQLFSLTLTVADLENAFCQSDSLDRSAGPLFVEPCEGLDLLSGSLFQLVAPVYGLNDASLRWHRTLTAWLIKQGYRKSQLQPCLYVHYAPGGSVDGLILIEVDHLAIGTKRVQKAEIQRRFQAAFRFGKWEQREASYAGRRIRQRDQYVLVDQKKNMLENFTLYICTKNSTKTGSSHWMSSITPFTCVQDQLGCQGESSRGFWICVYFGATPEGTHSVRCALIANRVVKFLHSSASQCLTIWRHDPRNVRVISVRDAGGIGGPRIENGEKCAECSSDHGRGR